MTAPSVADAFRLLQAGDAAGALKAAAAIVRSEPGNARAHLAAGIALRLLEQWDDSRKALEHAAALDPRDYAAPFELGALHEQIGRAREAIAQYERAVALRPQFAAAHFAAGAQKFEVRDWNGAAASFEAVLRLQPGNPDALVNLGQALAVLGRAGEAFARYEEALARDPQHLEALRALGRHCVRRADYARAAQLFQAAFTVAPQDPDLPMYLAQALLLLGRWSEAWAPYARRDSRIAYEAQAQRAGRPYRTPALDDIQGKDVALIAEQGLGDILFFLRFAPALRSRARSVLFVGEPRLNSILARTGAFDALVPAAAAEDVPVLVGDLPTVLGATSDIFAPSLRASADPARVESWQRHLETAGPRPWIAVTWRSGTSVEVSREALSKSIGVAELFGALAPLEGTVFALQRAIGSGELERARAALGRPVHDLSDASADLEDLLALVSLVDRHVGVSSTNMHLAALAGKTADVLVPFPPEWRWRPEGESPWFPGFRTFRQGPDGDWGRALAALAG